MKRLKALLLIFVFCVCLTPCMAVTSLADAVIDWYGNDQWATDYDIEVTDPDGYVNIRSGPGTDYGILTTAPTGTVLHVSTEGLASDGAIWCQVTYNGYTGWLALSRTAYVDTETASPTPEPTAAPTAAPEVTATPEATEAPAAVPDDTADTKTDTQKDIVLTTPTAAADAGQETAVRSATAVPVLLILLALLVLMVIAIAVLLIVLLRKKH